MNTFLEWYLSVVKAGLGRELTQEELDKAKQQYTQGWYPAETVEWLKAMAEKAEHESH